MNQNISLKDDTWHTGFLNCSQVHASVTANPSVILFKTDSVLCEEVELCMGVQKVLDSVKNEDQ